MQNVPIKVIFYPHTNAIIYTASFCRLVLLRIREKEKQTVTVTEVFLQCKSGLAETTDLGGLKVIPETKGKLQRKLSFPAILPKAQLKMLELLPSF